MVHCLPEGSRGYIRHILQVVARPGLHLTGEFFHTCMKRLNDLAKTYQNPTDVACVHKLGGKPL